MVNVHPIGRSREELAPVERGISGRDDRPRVRVGGRFAGEVSGIELGDGRVEVFEVERDERRDPLVGVDLDDVKGIVLNRLGVAAPDSNTGEDETLPTDRYGVHHRHRKADVSGHLQVSDYVISTILDLGIHHPSAIESRDNSRHGFSQSVPIARREVRPDVLEHARCGVR